MTYRGHVKNGRILLDEPAQLPEGAVVSIEVTEPVQTKRAKPRRKLRGLRPIDMPGGSLADELVNDRR